MEGGGGLGHGRPYPAGRHPDLDDVEVQESLAEQGRCASGHRFGGMIVPVGPGPGHTAEQRTGDDRPAVEFDGADLDPARIATDLDHFDLAKQLGHRARVGGQGPASTYGPSVVTPAWTEMLPVPPTAPTDAVVVAAAVVGIP